MSSLRKPINCDFDACYEKDGETGCWLWKYGKLTKGYGIFTKQGTRAVATHVSYEKYIGKIPDGLFVLHTCDTPSCVNPNHLFVGTQKDNMVDKKNKGRCADRSGNKHHLVKLTETKVRIIRGSVDTSKSLAARFGVSIGAIKSVRGGYSWAWLK